MKDKLIIQNKFRIQDNESIMHGLCCIAFSEHMRAGKASLDYSNLFSSNGYKRIA